MIEFNLPLSAFDSKVSRLLTQLKDRGYSETTILDYKEFLNCLKRYIQENRMDVYTPEDGDRFFEHYSASHSLADSSRRKRRAVIRRFNACCGNGKWVQTARPRRNPVEVPEEFAAVISRYLDHGLETGNKPITVNRKRQYSEEFASRLNSLGCTSPGQMTPGSVLDVCTGAAFTGSWPFIAQFLSYLFGQGITEKDFSVFVPKHRRKQPVPNTYSVDEVLQAEGAIDRSSPLGIRNYAIFALAGRCGLRCGDIVLLKITDLSVDTGRLGIIQQKTEVPLSITLPPVVRDAVSRYINEARPDTSDDTIFLSSRPPFGPLHPSAVYTVVDRAFKAAKVRTSGRKRGPHALRASMATSMVNDGIPYEAVRKILGHDSPETIKHYARVHIEKLREYSLRPPAAGGNFLLLLEGGQHQCIKASFQRRWCFS